MSFKCPVLFSAKLVGDYCILPKGNEYLYHPTIDWNGAPDDGIKSIYIGMWIDINGRTMGDFSNQRVASFFWRIARILPIYFWILRQVQQTARVTYGLDTKKKNDCRCPGQIINNTVLYRSTVFHIPNNRKTLGMFHFFQQGQNHVWSHSYESRRLQQD